MESYCLRCKDDTKTLSPYAEESKGRMYMKGECKDCGVLKCRAMPKGAGRKAKEIEYEEDDESESEEDDEEDEFEDVEEDDEEDDDDDEY